MEFDEKVQEVQNAFNEEHIKQFAIVSPELLAQSEYIRSLYIRMLCALMRSGKATEAQILFVRRLAAGAQLNDSFTELMRQSMNMDTESISAFLEALRPNDAKFYFVLDGCIACVLGAGGDRFAMLAECAELLGVTEIELRYLAQAAKAIVLQSSAAFDEAKKYRTARTENLSLFYHAKWFYNGVLVDTDECFHWYSADKQKLSLPACKLDASNIIIENAHITLKALYRFTKHNHVAFRNCFITSEDYSPIQFASVNEVEFTGCTVQNFRCTFCNIDHVTTLTVKRNVFRSCVNDKGLFREDDWHYLGLKNVSFVGNSIVQCENTYSDNAEAAALGSIQYCKKLQVTGNSFVGHKGSSRAVFVWKDDGITEKDIHDNKLSGSVTQICCFEA